MQVTPLKRPYVIIHTLTSLDGRIHNMELPSSIRRRFSTNNWRCMPISKS